MTRLAQGARPVFSQPIRQILLMLISISLVGATAWFMYPALVHIFEANQALAFFILGVFALGVLTCFWQVWQLVQAVSWIDAFVLVGIASCVFRRRKRLHVSRNRLLLRDRVQRCHCEFFGCCERAAEHPCWTRDPNCEFFFGSAYYSRGQWCRLCPDRNIFCRIGRNVLFNNTWSLHDDVRDGVLCCNG